MRSMIPLVFRGCAFLVGRRSAEPEHGHSCLCAQRAFSRLCLCARETGGMSVWRTDLEVCVPSAVERSYFNSNFPQSNAIILVMTLTSSWRTFVPSLKKTITLLLSRPAASDMLFASCRFATVTKG